MGRRMTDRRIWSRLKSAAELLEAIAQQRTPSLSSATANSTPPAAEYIDMSSGQMRVPGGVKQAGADQATSVGADAAREAARIRKLLAQLEAEEDERGRSSASE
jgi:hypothetical protein